MIKTIVIICPQNYDLKNYGQDVRMRLDVSSRFDHRITNYVEFCYYILDLNMNDSMIYIILFRKLLRT